MAMILYSNILHLMEYNTYFQRYMISKAIGDWLSETGIIDRMGEDCFVLPDKSIQYGLCFDREEDATAFKLMWM